MNPLRALFLQLSRMPPALMLVLIIGLAVLITMTVTGNQQAQEQALKQKEQDLVAKMSAKGKVVYAIGRKGNRAGQNPARRPHFGFISSRSCCQIWHPDRSNRFSAWPCSAGYLAGFRSQTQRRYESCHLRCWQQLRSGWFRNTRESRRHHCHGWKRWRHQSSSNPVRRRSDCCGSDVPEGSRWHRRRTSQLGDGIALSWRC